MVILVIGSTDVYDRLSEIIKNLEETCGGGDFPTLPILSEEFPFDLPPPIFYDEREDIPLPYYTPTPNFINRPSQDVYAQPVWEPP